MLNYEVTSQSSVRNENIMAEAVYLRSSEFAKFVNTTKATLRHYREIGLLEPARVTESGYALYGSLQASQYYLIASLRLAGCTLSQIKEYLDLANAADMRDIMIEKVEDLERKQRELELRKHILLTSIKKADELSIWGDSLHSNEIAWKMRERPEEYFIKTPAPLQDDDETGVLDAINEHGRFLVEYGSTEELQGGYGVERSAFEEGRYAEGFMLLTRISERIENERLLTKPAGTYFCWLKRTTAADLHGAQETVPLYAEYDKLRTFLKKQELRPISDIFETELSLYSGSLSETLFYEIELQVEPPGV